MKYHNSIKFNFNLQLKNYLEILVGKDAFGQ